MRLLQHGALEQIVRWMSTTEFCVLIHDNQIFIAPVLSG